MQGVASHTTSSIHRIRYIHRDFIHFGAFFIVSLFVVQKYKNSRYKLQIIRILPSKIPRLVAGCNPCRPARLNFRLPWAGSQAVTTATQQREIGLHPPAAHCVFGLRPSAPHQTQVAMIGALIPYGERFGTNTVGGGVRRKTDCKTYRICIPNFSFKCSSMVRPRRWRRTVPARYRRPLGLLLAPLLVRPLLLPDAFHLALLKPFKAKEYAALGIEVNEVEPQCSALFVSIAQGDHEVGYVGGNRHRLVGEQRGNVCDQLRLVLPCQSVAVERITSREKMGGIL